MAEMSNKSYKFRFNSSDETVELNDEEIDAIPYLKNLIKYQDDFLYLQNEHGEYRLNSPIEYQWFLPILRSIQTKNASDLFNQLSEDENIFDVFQLYNYLRIKSFPLPFLRNEKLVLSDPSPPVIENEEKVLRYSRASQSESEQTAAEFLFALANYQYQICRNNIKTFFSLIDTILSDMKRFSARFRHHTLTITKKRCYSLFSKNQLRQLQNNKSVSYHSEIFSWRGEYVLQNDQERQTNRRENPSNSDVSIDRTFSCLKFLREQPLSCRSFYNAFENNPNDNDLSTELTDLYSFDINLRLRLRRDFERIDFFVGEYPEAALQSSDNEMESVLNDIRGGERKKDEAKSARLGYLNTLPRKVQVDKFRHRSNRKAQLYRQ